MKEDAPTNEPIKNPEKIRAKARDLFWEGYSFAEISAMDDMPVERTIRRWADKYRWADNNPNDSIELLLNARLGLLLERENKTEGELKELDFLMGHYLTLCGAKPTKKTARSESVDTAGADSDAPKPKRGRSKKKQKNDLSGITKEQLDKLADEILHPHQKVWFANRFHRTRFILKPRQIGATFYFAFEALYSAVVEKDNQIFISASRAQAKIFKTNIMALCRRYFGIELKGDPIELIVGDNQTAVLSFMSTNILTAQSYSGHLYFDEAFWTPKFDDLRNVATAMSTHEKYRVTYFSTPSSTSHAAYKLWNGRWYRQTMACKDPFFEVDVDKLDLSQGLMCEDHIWRWKMDIYQVVDFGMTGINIEILERTYSREAFNMLFMCVFVDGANSAFDVNVLSRCVIDDCPKWFDESQPRPAGNRPVAIGYDPARVGDINKIVVIALPVPDDDKFYKLESEEVTSSNFQVSADRIELLTERYNVVHIGIDTTGLGAGTYDLVYKFFPAVTAYHYSVNLKNSFVIKAKQVFSAGRFALWMGVEIFIASFLSIRQANNGDKVNYVTNRTSETGHADEAWAVMHALAYEDLATTRTTEMKESTYGL